jgi:hypothetical protein
VNFFRENRKFHINDGEPENSIFNIDERLVLDEQSLVSYLSLGYVPGERTLFKGVLCKGEREFCSLQDSFAGLSDFRHTKSELKELVLNSVEKKFNSSKDNIVPISGGMDSRIILAALCEMTETSNIQTYTFGVPGALDFDIANSIAKHLGTKHVNFDAADTEYTVDGLIRAAIATDANTEIFHPLVLNRVADYYGEQAEYWSGYAGDLVGGGFSSKLGLSEPKESLKKYEQRGIHFGDHNHSELTKQITTSNKMYGYVSDVEACFWENHVERYTGHHIFRNDMKIHAPMVSAEFLKYFFTLPSDLRMGKSHFNDCFSSIFQNVFQFPTVDYGYKYSSRSNVNHWAFKAAHYARAIGWRISPKLIPHPSTAYLDLRNLINSRRDVRTCVDTLLSDLKQRNIIDNDKMKMMLNMHRSDKFDYTKDIINLASLEAILKASEI